MTPAAAALIDNAPLIAMTREFMAGPGRNFVFHPFDGGAEAVRLGFRSAASHDRLAYIVTAGNAAIELGSPRHASLATLLWTREEGLVTEGVWTAGIGFDGLKGSQAPLLLTIMAQVPENFDPGNASFRSIINLSNRIPGYMARSVPGKLWIRIAHGLLSKGFSPLSLGQCLIHAFHDAAPLLRGVEVLIAAGDAELTDSFEPLFNLASAYAGKNRKLSLQASGVLACEDLSCTSCDEKPSCDTIREIVTIKKSKREREEA